MTGFKQFSYGLAKQLGGAQVAKLLTRHHPKILMYHRVSADIDGPGISVNQFRKHVEIIKNHFNPMTLSALLTAYENGTVPPNAVVITFDDGYADFAEKAFPILREAQIPATLFITTGFVSGDLWLWPDQIRYAVNRSAVSKLKHPTTEKILELKSNPIEAWQHIAEYCLTISNERKLEFIEQVCQQLKVQLPSAAPEEYKSVSWPQIKYMVAEGLDVGSHSITHPILTQLTDEQLLRELKFSKNKIESEVGKAINLFCYPNGMASDFDERVKKLLSELSYRYAVCAYPSKKPLNDRWCINRYPVGSSFDLFVKNIFGLSYLRMKN